MDDDATPAVLRLNTQLGQASEAPTLVERLRTDVLWHRRRGNETIASDCQEAADMLERLEPMEMALCERHSLVLRVGQPYVFRPVGDCESCAEALARAQEAYGPSAGAPNAKVNGAHGLPCDSV